MLQAKLASVQLGALDGKAPTNPKRQGPAAGRRRGGDKAARAADAPANNVVLGPDRRAAGNMLRGLTACLPAALLLALPALPQLPPLAGVVPALLVASLVATYDA